ncbi:MAG: insulinase family protein [Blastocatellia bacterium]|nr:insulinase family protein [Blastocatellia bacterium]
MVDLTAVATDGCSSSNIQKTVLENGLIVVTEKVDHVSSVSLGIWVKAGSRHEQAQENGITHFIEHTVFKGTQNRTARQIALEADILGGNLDAFTTSEFTGFCIRVLKNNLSQAFDIVADLLVNPTFDSVEIERERAVIIEEIKMTEDSPEEFVSELFHSSFWPNHPVGRPIAGTIETVNALSRDQIVAYYQQAYNPANLLITAAGRIEHQQIVDLANNYFGLLTPLKTTFSQQPPKEESRIVIKKKRGLEQTQIILGAPAPSICSKERYTCSIFNTILGGGLSSRLFQKVREEHGLAYSVSSNLNLYTDAGCLAVYMAVANKNVKKAISLVMKEITTLKTELVSEKELQATKDQIKANMILDLESVTSHMSSLAESELFFGHHIALAETFAGIDAVTVEDLIVIAKTIFDQEKIAVAILAPTERLKLDREHLAC